MFLVLSTKAQYMEPPPNALSIVMVPSKFLGL
jgi:hypothetical protein